MKGKIALFLQLYMLKLTRKYMTKAVSIDISIYTYTFIHISVLSDALLINTCYQAWLVYMCAYTQSVYIHIHSNQYISELKITGPNK